MPPVRAPKIRNRMFGLFLYALGCLAAASIVVMLRAFTMKAGRIGEGSNALLLLLTWAVVVAAPYGWVETQTTLHRKDFAPVVTELAERGHLDGDPVYFKVQAAGEENAKLILVTGGENTWGGTYRNIYSLRLDKSAAGWWVKSVDPVNTTDGDSAGFTFPPYW